MAPELIHRRGPDGLVNGDSADGRVQNISAEGIVRARRDSGYNGLSLDLQLPLNGLWHIPARVSFLSRDCKGLRGRAPSCYSVPPRHAESHRKGHIEFSRFEVIE